jgi:hypothetical protein
VRVAEEDERGTDIAFNPFDTVHVGVEPNTAGLSASEWVAAGNLGGTQGQTTEPATIDGRSAVLVRAAPAAAELYVAAVADRIFVVSYQNAAGDATSTTAMQRMIRSFHILSTAERSVTPSPVPTAPRTVETVTDVLVRGFANLDADGLATVMSPCVSAFAENAGGTFTPRSAFVSQLRTGFANGLRVTVDPQVLTDAIGTYVRATWVQPGAPTQRRDLYLRSIGDTWSWHLVLTRQPLR